MIGIGFLLLLDNVTPHMHMDEQMEGPKSNLKRTTKLILAVTLHNIPEGMAVGVVYAGWVAGESGISRAAAFAAGAMMYVVVEELIPEMSEGGHSNVGTVAFALGFVLMMVLDVALG